MSEAEALVIAGDPSASSQRPTDDPGWTNVPVGGSQGMIYIGNSWVLTARHVNNFQSQALHLEGGSYNVVPGTEVRLKNPTSGGYSEFSDLWMYRIDGKPEADDPNVKPISIATTGPAVGQQLTVIGRGGIKNSIRPFDSSQSVLNDSVELSYAVDKKNLSGAAWTWSQEYVEGDPRITPGNPQYDPVLAASLNVRAVRTTNAVADIDNAEETRRWGRNVVSNVGQLFNQGSSATIRLTDPARGDIVARAFQFDLDGGIEHEVTALGGDSGSAVFWKNGQGQWKLAGIIHAVKFYQPGFTPNYDMLNIPVQYAFDDMLVFFSDLASYSTDINKLLSNDYSSYSNLGLYGYSKLGDVNLDGVVTGDGSGSAATDDISAFIAGWRSDNGSGVGDILSWKKGDLNFDGLTDLQDFALLRVAFGGTIGASATQAILGVGAVGVPEPSGIATALLAVLTMGAWRARAAARRVEA
ncbi:hypothetical protein [Pirellulimonas nuda]|uniref:hypothetical protein n=1 Tax=Pirellulimonas nuda TaxID=2528009 RepID=UPI0011A0C445|nr:hypothetical protein [Pirellulimonas nuda]